MGVYNDFMTAMPGIIGHYSLSPVKIFVLAGIFRCFFFFFFVILSFQILGFLLFNE